MAGWTSLGGTWIREPFAVAVGPDRLALFGVNRRHEAMIRWRVAGEWGSWRFLVANSIATPFAVSAGPDRMDVFTVERNHSLWHRCWQRRWHRWEELRGEAGGLRLTAPRAVWSTPGRLDVLVLGSDLAIWSKSHLDGHWQDGWVQPGVLMLSPPSVVSRLPGTIDMVTLDENRDLLHGTLHGAAWTWQRLDAGEEWTSAPHVVGHDGGLDVFLLSPKRELYHVAWTGKWSAPRSLGLYAVEPPQAVCAGPGHLDVVAVDVAGQVARRACRDYAWRDWQPLDGPAHAPPSLVAQPDGTVEVFVLGPDSAIWHTVCEPVD